MVARLTQLYSNRKLISNIAGAVGEYCLGSDKTAQLACRRALATSLGCDYNSLGLQPPQFLIPSECSLLHSAYPAAPVLIKPTRGLGGKGIALFPLPPPNCSALPPSLAQIYVASPALYLSRKFDLRTWLVIVRLAPLTVYTSPGFARVSSRAFDPNDPNLLTHITNLDAQYSAQDHWQPLLSMPLPDSFFNQTHAALRFALQAQFLNVRLNSSFFHLFAADWVLDQSSKVHLLEINGQPVFKPKWPSDRLMWRDMAQLIVWAHWNFTLLPHSFRAWTRLDTTLPLPSCK